MFEPAETVEATALSDQIDELSTRLIIDGVATLAPADFERLGQLADELGSASVAGVARRIAHDLADTAESSVPGLTRLLSSALVEMRTLLEDSSLANRPETASDAAPAPAPHPPSESPEANPLAADEDLIREFITESTEHLQTIESQMLVLEKGNSSTDTLNAVFRGFHTIKGLAGFLEFAEIQALAHEVETLLDLARTGQLTVTPAVVDVVLESTDIVRQELDAIAQRLEGRTPPPTNVTPALLQRVRSTASGEVAESHAPRPSELADTPASPDGLNPPHIQEPVGPRAAALESLPPISPPPNAPKLAGDAPRAEDGQTAGPARQGQRPNDASSVRIDTGKLDQLMDMVGEMVIAQTLIGNSPSLASIKDARFLRDLSQLARITGDVQRITTGMRMVPIGLQFQKTARMIRDLSRRAGKKIELVTTGDDTELDKSIAEELSDPLLHMVRNSIDHGIETPEERIALGKDPTACIRIEAYHQSGQIVVAISDDGRGLSREKILAKAKQNGIVQGGGEQLSDNEIFALIFEAGFSTAEKVTDISGRGVGMDVVRRHVQKLRGRIDIQSKAGVGTTFFLKLPLTLAIIEGLVVVVGQQRYIVPIFSVKEMFRPKPEALSTVHGTGEMVMVRGGLLPIVRLHRQFKAEPRTVLLTEGTLIVAESEGRQFCLFVDDLVGKQEVVIKSLGQSFKKLVGIAGCAILGDGRVGLILDVDGIYKGRA